MLISIVLKEGPLSALDVPLAGSNSFIFKIEKLCMTSAGVFSKDKKLIRTLWSGRKYEAGKYTEQWDGKDDEGNLAPGGNYNIIILSNNMKYEWEGVIGNTSDSFTGSTVYNNNSPICTMAIADGTAYFASGYNERKSSQQKFSLINPQKKIGIVSDKPAHSSYYVATDGNVVYWAGVDGEQKWFVFGTAAADDSFINFESGTEVSAKYGRTYNAIDNLIGKEFAISGLAVQKKGDCLFIAHKALNQVHVLNKTTGSLLQKLPFKQPSLLAIDNNDNIWILYDDNAIEKFSVQKNGTLASLNIRIEKVSDIQAFAVAPDNKYLLSAIGGDSQQLLAFSTKDGSLIWTFGQQGGYSLSSEVMDDKFYFTGIHKPRSKSFVCFSPDGSFWVGDPGNYRVQHYNPDRKFLERIMYVPTFYSCVVDHNNPERAFADYLEFKIDYSKPLSPVDPHWKLVRNWGNTIPSDMDNQYLRFKCVTTLSNNRTYALLFGKDRQWQLVELGQNNRLRFTGISFSEFTQLYPDGSLHSISTPKIGSTTTFSTRTLSDFDGLSNPTWKSEEVFAESPVNTAEEPLFKANLPALRTGEITDSGVLVSFDQSAQNMGWHLGGLVKNSKQWQWKTARSTNKNYNGDFPVNGDFDIGNGVRNAGSVAIVIANHIFWGYHGEFWKGSQTNKWNHVYHNGLFINQFGKTFPELKGKYPAEMAGNAVSASVIKAGNGKTYLYHNDENYHGGIHRWLITGFETIEEQNILLSVSHIDKGISGIYFKDPDLNNFSVQTIVVDSNIDFPSLPLGSVRWIGFLKSDFSEEFTFYATANGRLRLWIENDLIIDKWQNNVENSFEASYVLSTDKLAKIKLELAEARHISVFWSSQHVPKTIIPKASFAPVSNLYHPSVYNLLDGLPKGKTTVLENNLYGWQRNPVEENHTDSYRDWWSVQNNIKNYGIDNENTDLRIIFKKPNASASLTRNISLPRPVNSWTLSGIFNFTGNQPNRLKDEFMFFDIVDKEDRIIARFFITSVSIYPDAILYFNSSAVAHDSHQTHLQIFDKKHSVIIKAVNGKLFFTMENFNTSTDSVFEQDADWHQPSKFRITFGAGKQSFIKTVNLSDLILSIQ